MLTWWRRSISLRAWPAVSCGLLVFGCAPSSEPPWPRTKTQIEAPDFSLPRLDGTMIHFADYHGKVVAVEFWATWCGPCRQSMPSLEQMYREYRDRGVTVLLVNCGEEAQAVQRWAGSRYTAPILLDREMQVSKLYGVHGIPQLFVIDRTGHIAYTHGGYAGGLEKNLKNAFDELLSEVVSPAKTTDGGGNNG